MRGVAALHVVVRVGGERFGFRIADVEEALDAPRLAPVPCAPPGLLGQLRYRERTVRAFDAGWLFGVARDGGAGMALVFRDGPERVVLVVDEVDDLADVPPEQIRPVPSGADGEGVLRGVSVAADGRLVSLVRTSAMVSRATALASFDRESVR